MTWLLIGLLGFLGLHSLRIVAPGWRQARIAAMGEGPWKGLYSLLSIAFFALLVWGYGQARQAPVLLWQPPMALRHVGYLLVLLAFVLLVATYVPRNHLKARLQHPMLLATKSWALGHLLMSGWLHSVLVFGAFLAWAVFDFTSAKRRQAPVSQAPRVGMTVLAVVLGVVAYAVFAMHLHAWLIGVQPIMR